MAANHIITALAVFGALISAHPAPAQTLGQPTDVEFKAKIDGTAQRYIEMLPSNFDESQPHSLLIAFHGGGSDRWQYAKDPRDECRASRDIAAKYNMIYICPDCRGKGGWMSPRAESDLVQIIKDLRHKYKIDKIFLVGASMGACNVLSFTAIHPELVSGVSAQNALVNYFEFAGESVGEAFGGAPKDLPAVYKKFSAAYWPEKFTMPVAFTVGGKDPLAPPESVRVFDSVLKALGAKELLIDRPDTSHLTNYEDTTAALEFVISNAKSK